MNNQAKPVSPPWRRFLRLSVRGLMVVVLLIGIGLGWMVRPIRSARVQRDAVLAIVNAGGFVQYNGETPSAFDVSNWEDPDGTPNFDTWQPHWLLHLGGADLLARVTDVSLCAQKRSAAIERIADLSRLRALRLTGPAISDGDLVHVKGLTGLLWLDVTGTQVTDDGLLHLKKMATLFKLDVGNTQITDKGLVHLEGLSNLRWLDVTGTQVTDAGVKKIQAALPGITVSQTPGFRCHLE
jgi:hypothetical protein